MSIYYEGNHYLAVVGDEGNGKVLVREIHKLSDGYEVYDHTTATIAYIGGLKRVAATIEADIMDNLRNILI